MYPKEVKDHPKHLVSIKDLFHFLKSKVSLIWHTYLSLLRFFQIYRGNLASNSKLECLPWRLLCIFSWIHRLWGNYWQYQHSCLWIDFHVAFQPCSSVCDAYFKLLCFNSVTKTKTTSSMWLKSDNNWISLVHLHHLIKDYM